MIRILLDIFSHPQSQTQRIQRDYIKVGILNWVFHAPLAIIIPCIDDRSDFVIFRRVIDGAADAGQATYHQLQSEEDTFRHREGCLDAIETC